MLLVVFFDEMKTLQNQKERGEVFVRVLLKEGRKKKNVREHKRVPHICT